MILNVATLLNDYYRSFIIDNDQFIAYGFISNMDKNRLTASAYVDGVSKLEIKSKALTIGTHL